MADHTTSDAYVAAQAMADADSFKLRQAVSGVRVDRKGILSQLATYMGTKLFGKAQTSTATISLPASTTAKAPLNCLPGSAPTSPVDGDIWIEGTSLKLRISGATRTIASS